MDPEGDMPEGTLTRRDERYELEEEGDDEETEGEGDYEDTER